MNAPELLSKLKNEGWSLEADRIYPTGCVTFLRMGKPLVDELIQSGILQQVKGCPDEWELNPITILIGEDNTKEDSNSTCPTDQGRTNPLGFRRFLVSERRAA